MNNDGKGYVYADQRAAEDRVNELRGSLVSLVETLDELNESIDSLKLYQVIGHAKFQLGL